MTIRVVVAGATGWTGSALVKAIAASKDLALAGGVSRSAAGRDIGTANGIDAIGEQSTKKTATLLRHPVAATVLADEHNWSAIRGMSGFCHRARHPWRFERLPRGKTGRHTRRLRPNR